MPRLLSASFVLLLVPSLPGQQPDRYEDPQGRFVLTPPVGWTAQADPDGSVLFSLPGQQVVLGVVATPLDRPATLGEVASGYAELLRARPGVTAESTSVDDLQLAGRPARHCTFKLTGTGVPAVHLEATFVLLSDRLCLTLSATAPAGLWARHQTEIDAAVRSLRLPGERRPANPLARGGARSEIEQQLRALEQARQAGILSDAEYEQKKAELQARLQAASAPDEAVARKLRALEEAHRAGVLSDEEFAQKRREIAGAGRPVEPSAGGDRRPEAVAAERARSAVKGKTYRHPVGFTFWYPDGWQVQAQEDYLQLLPPDPSGGADAPNEIYLVIGDRIDDEDIKTVDHPRIAAYLEQQVQGISPVFRRHGQTEPVTMARGRGAMLEWRGSVTGQPEALARCFACIVQDHGIALLALGLPADIDRRDAEVRQIFGSFGFGEGSRDPALVGSWSLVSTVSVRNDSVWETDWSRASAVAETQSSLLFRPDGTWLRTDDYHMIALAAGVSLESKDRKESRGTWNAGEGSLFMIWEDHTWEDYQYRVQPAADGRELRLICGKTGQIWKQR